MKNLKRYYQAWELRQQGKKLQEIGDIMGVSRERIRTMVYQVDFVIKERKRPVPKALKEIIARVKN